METCKKNYCFPQYIYIIYLALQIFISNSFADSSPRIGLVLSGGGARGIAQVGILKALDEAGIKPDLIVATSMGAIIGSMYAAGVSAIEIDSIVKFLDWDDIFANTARRRHLLVSQKSEPFDHLFELRFDTDLTPVIPKSISHGQSIYNLLSPILSSPLYHSEMCFDSLAIPLRIIATDILTGNKVVFSEGDLSKIVRASCGVPLAFSPVQIDTFLLLDGGLSANIPIETALNEGCNYIIAVDVTSPMWNKDDLKNPIRLVDQIIAGSINKNKKRQLKSADIIIKPDLVNFRNTDFSNIDSLVLKGYIATKKVLPTLTKKIAALKSETVNDTNTDKSFLYTPIIFEITKSEKMEIYDTLTNIFKKLENINISTDSLFSCLSKIFSDLGLSFAKAKINKTENGHTCVTINPGIISGIKITGNRKTSERIVKRISGFKTGNIILKRDISKAIAAIYATGLFYNVNINVNESNIVNIFLKEKEYWRTRFSLRFDEYHLVEGYIQPAYENLFGTGICALLHLQYGPIREKYAFELNINRLFTQNWANTICFQNYISRERIIRKEENPDTLADSSVIFKIDYNETCLRKSGILAKVGTQIGRFAMWNIGIRFERFKLSQSTQSALNNPLGVSFKGQGLRYLMCSFIFDNLDRFPFPRKGQQHYINIGGASSIIGGTENFINLHASFCSYFTFRKRHTFSPYLLFTWADQALPPVEQVYIGGTVPAEKYREMGIYYYTPFIGLKKRAISGDVVLLLHGLYRFAIREKFFLSIIADWGYAWHEDKDSNLPGFEFDKKTMKYFFKHAPVGIGAGLAYKTPVGPIKFSWGRVVSGLKNLKENYNISEGNVFYFSIGHDF